MLPRAPPKWAAALHTRAPCCQSTAQTMPARGSSSVLSQRTGAALAGVAETRKTSTRRCAASGGENGAARTEAANRARAMQRPSSAWKESCIVAPVGGDCECGGKGGASSEGCASSEGLSWLYRSNMGRASCAEAMCQISAIPSVP
eukprot:5972416-Prymnesium_polylepis.2